MATKLYRKIVRVVHSEEHTRQDPKRGDLITFHGVVRHVVVKEADTHPGSAWEYTCMDVGVYREAAIWTERFGAPENHIRVIPSEKLEVAKGHIAMALSEFFDRTWCKISAGEPFADGVAIKVAERRRKSHLSRVVMYLRTGGNVISGPYAVVRVDNNGECYHGYYARSLQSALDDFHKRAND